MRVLKYILLFFFIFNFSYAQQSELENKITKNLRCLVCQGQSVYDSDSEFANSLKLLVKKKLSDPEFNKKTYFLWLMPILMFLIGGLLIFKLFIIRKN